MHQMLQRINQQLIDDDDSQVHNEISQLERKMKESDRPLKKKQEQNR